MKNFATFLAKYYGTILTSGSQVAGAFFICHSASALRNSFWYAGQIDQDPSHLNGTRVGERTANCGVVDGMRWCCKCGSKRLFASRELCVCSSIIRVRYTTLADKRKSPSLWLTDANILKDTGVNNVVLQKFCTQVFLDATDPLPLVGC